MRSNLITNPVLYSVIAFSLIICEIKAQPVWQSVGLVDVPVYAFGIMDDYLFAGGNVSEGGILKTNDFGDNWSPANGGLPQFGALVYSMFSYDTILYASMGSSGLYFTTDLGDDWDFLNHHTENYSVWNIDYAGHPWNVFYAGGGRFDARPAVMISADGLEWSSINEGFYLIAPVYSMTSFDTSLYAGTHRGVFRYDLNATEWDESNTGLEYQSVFSLVKSDQYFFAGTQYKGIFRSADGINWLPANHGIDSIQSQVNIILVDGANIYAGFSGDHPGVYRSTDQGDSWELMNVGLPDGAEVYALAIKPPYLFAGTRHHGVFRMDSVLSGIQEHPDLSSINLHPNPNDGVFELAINLPEAGDYFLTLTNVEGQEIYTSFCHFGAGNNDFLFSGINLKPGFYCLSVRGKKLILVEKFIVH